MAKHKIILNKKDCISCGACAAICPEFFGMDEEGMADLKEGESKSDVFERIIETEEDRARVQEAVDACPVEVIKLEKIED